MNEEFIVKIQSKVMALLMSISADLRVASKDQCSEITRLVGCWILNENPEYKIQVCKGIFSDKSAHDILKIDNGEALLMIDPTIWQKFPESKSIFVGSANNESEMFNLLEKKYGGLWKVSEILSQCDADDQNNLLIVIERNVKNIAQER